MANPAMCRLVGKAQEELGNKRLSEFIKLDQIEDMEIEEQEILAGAFSSSEENWQLGNQTRIYETLKVPLFKDQHTIQGLCCIMRDITHLKQTEQHLRASLSEKQLLLKEVHHRVKNNLNVIVGLLRLQGMKNNQPEVHKLVDDMVERIISMSITYDLLCKSEQFQDMDFSNYLDSLITHLKSSYEELLEGIDLDIQIGELRLTIDQAAPCGLLVNEIITNSMKHAFPHTNTGKIYIYASRHDDHYVLEIGDNGIGIAPEQRTQLDRDSLGWKLIQSLPNQFMGEIQTRFEEGIHFTITFPVQFPWCFKNVFSLEVPTHPVMFIQEWSDSLPLRNNGDLKISA
jgi:PAS domain S-box-containing protein